MGHRTDSFTQLLLLHSIRPGFLVVVLAVSLRFLPLRLRDANDTSGELNDTTGRKYSTSGTSLENVRVKEVRLHTPPVTIDTHT